MKEKSLSELADEYAQCIKNTDLQIKSVLKALSKAKKEHKNMLVSKLNSNLAMLYRQRSEQVEIEAYLRGYDKDDNGDENEVKKAG